MAGPLESFFSKASKSAVSLALACSEDNVIQFDRKLLMEQNPDSDKLYLIQIRFGRSGYLSKLAAHRQNRGLDFNDCFTITSVLTTRFYAPKKGIPGHLVNWKIEVSNFNRYPQDMFFHLKNGSRTLVKL